MDWMLAGLVVMISGTLALKWFWRRARPDPSVDVTAVDRPQMQLGDDVKAMYPDKGAQDAILKAWNTGKPVVWNRPK